MNMVIKNNFNIHRLVSEVIGIEIHAKVILKF